VRFIKDGSNEVQYNVNRDATVNITVASSIFSNGDSLNTLHGDKNGLEIPANLISIVSGFGERAAMRAGKVAAVSAPSTFLDEIPNVGAILFYKWDGGSDTWEYDEIEYGSFSNEKLGSKQLEFLNDDTLKVVSEGFKIEYQKNRLVSFPMQKIHQYLLFQCN